MQVGRKKRVFNNLKKTKTLKNLKQKWNYKIPRLEDLQLKTLHTNMKYLAATHGSIWGNQQQVETLEESPNQQRVS